MQIYLTINKKNGKMYIGKDTRNRKNYLGSGALFRKALEKYGRESFVKVILCDNIECKEELSKKEMEFISIFDAANSDRFYNISSGSELWGFELGKEIYQFSIDGEFIRKYGSLEEVCREFKAAKGNLSQAASGKRNYFKGYRWSYSNEPNDIIETKRGRKKGVKNSYKIGRIHHNIKNVEIICEEDGVFFKKFQNRREAAEYFGTTLGTINQYVISGKKYRKKYTFSRGKSIQKTVYKK